MSNNSPDVLKTLLNAADNINHTISGMKKIGMPTKDISDGYHTFGDLYHHRALLFASVLCIPEINKCAWKSKKHFDNDKDPMYDGMFIVGFTAELDGKKYEASYHYDIDPYWDKYFGHVKEIDHAPEFSGYTPEDSINTIYTVASYWFNSHEGERMWYEEDAIKKRKEENTKVTDAVIDHGTGKISLYNSEKEKITELPKEEVINIASHLGGGAMGIVKGSTADIAQETLRENDRYRGSGYCPWSCSTSSGGGGGGNGKQGTVVIYYDDKPRKEKAKVRLAPGQRDKIIKRIFRCL